MGKPVSLSPPRDGETVIEYGTRQVLEALDVAEDARERALRSFREDDIATYMAALNSLGLDTAVVNELLTYRELERAKARGTGFFGRESSPEEQAGHAQMLEEFRRDDPEFFEKICGARTIVSDIFDAIAQGAPFEAGGAVQ